MTMMMLTNVMMMMMIIITDAADVRFLCLYSLFN